MPWAIVITVLLTPVYYKLQTRYRNSSRELRRISTVALSPLYNHINESLQGLSTIRAFRVISRFMLILVKIYYTNKNLINRFNL